MDTVFDLNIKSLTFPPDQEEALHDIALRVKKGEFVAVTGPSAAGKSLLLHTLCGAAMKYDGGVLDGSVLMNEKDIMAIPLPAVCTDLGYMFQEPQNQIVSITVKDEVAFGLANLEFSREEIAARSAEALSYVGLNDLFARKTTSLSGGQAQRLVLAGILAMKTPVLLLDQPAAELDLKGKRDLYALIKRLHAEENVTVVMVMDNGVDVAAFADRVIAMENGTVKAEYTPENVPQFQVAKKDQKVPSFVTGETMMEINDVSYTYPGAVLGCENISCSVRRGDFLAIMGENGSGKTTLLKLMEGLLFPQKGDVKIFGRPMMKKTAFSLREKIGFLFQNPDFQIFANTVKAEAAFALRNKTISAEEKEAIVTAALSQVGLSPYADVHPQRLSRSQRQKLAAASAMIHDPDLVIADEPTAGLNEADSRLLMDLLADFCRKGKTVILVSHDPALVLTYANRVLLMENHHVLGAYEQEDFGEVAAYFGAGGKQDEAI